MHVSAVPSLDTSAELVWVKINFSNKNPIFIYRPPNNLLEPLIQLQESLNRLLNDSVSLPSIILAGDFNFPDIHWIDGNGQLQPNPAYGHKSNSLFLDIINDFSLEQFVTFPTRGKNILDLIFSSLPILHKLSVIPGMSDHEAILFSINSGGIYYNTKVEHKVFLYHKGNIDGIKDDLTTFQSVCMSCDPHSRTVENNWNHFKSSLQATIIKHIPQKVIKSKHDLPWLNHINIIKSKMHHRKHLYDVAKQSGKPEDWAAYRAMRNQVNNEIECAHNTYCSKLFDDSFSGNCRQFWKYIRTRRKDSSGISTLLVNDEYISDPAGKASTLSNQFQSVFTIEDQSSVPSLDSIDYISTMPVVSITTRGIENLLGNLDPSKAMGPDKILLYILKYCAAKISPILQLIFTQSLNTGQLPSDWLKANICPVFKKGNCSNPSNYRPIPLTSSCCKVFEHIVFHSIMDHVQLNNILINNQHGFRSGFSCQTQLISLIEDVSHALDNQLQTD